MLRLLARLRASLPAAVVLLGTVGSLATAYYTSHHGRAYASAGTVVLLIPRSAANQNVLGIQTESLVATAGIVSADVKEELSRPALDLLPATHSLEVVNDGSQFQNNFDQPVINISVQDTSPGRVVRDLDLMRGLIARDLEVRQSAAHVAPANRIGALFSPPAAQPVSVGGSPKRAAAASLVLGGILTSLAVREVRRLPGGRSTGGGGPGSAPGPAPR